LSTQNNTVSGNVVDVPHRRIYPATLDIRDGNIHRIVRRKQSFDRFLLPGFIDAHVHIESSMLTPPEFARIAVIHGTVATVSDPHEIGNVLGVRGVEYMIAEGKRVPFKFYFGVPSCVPATPFETAGSEINAAQVAKLLKRADVRYLAEVMNFPGVLARDPMVMAKIVAAQRLGKPVDGHAPGLRGRNARLYASAGISTDHECVTKEEALEKLRCGMKILIREGSAAKNFDALCSLIDSHTDSCMFCSDDKHPDELVRGHINVLVRRALALGFDRFDVLRVACVNPVLHYGLDVGLLRRGDPADFIVVDDFERLTVLQTYIRGRVVADAGWSRMPQVKSRTINQFRPRPRRATEFAVPATGREVRVIEALNGQLITNELRERPPCVRGKLLANPRRDLLKIAVVNRYTEAPPAVGFVRNFGLRHGALASSVAHDSHNIVAVGASDQALADAINLVAQHRGGVCVVGPNIRSILPLPVAGLMSNQGGWKVAARYSMVDALAKELGTKLDAPFMTLSFMALLVIPHLKLSDRGLFSSDHGELVAVTVHE
jgi:adenine deaminase